MMNSKRTNKPTEEAAGALAQFDQLHATLRRTHDEIPRLLARQRHLSHDLGMAEATGGNTETLRGELAATEAEREAAVRRRMAALDAIMALEASLQGERAAVESERREYALRAVTAHLERQAAALNALQQVWAEGRALAAALRCEVPVVLPVTVTTSPVDGSSRAVPVRSGDAPPVDVEAAKLGAQIDRFDAALALCTSIRESRLLDQRHYALAQLRGQSTEHVGLYVVEAQFQCMLDGEVFEVGRLVDASLIGNGSIARLQAGKRYIMPVGLLERAAA